MNKTCSLFSLAAVCGSWLHANPTVVSFNLDDKIVKEIHYSEINSTQIYSRDHIRTDFNEPNHWILVTADRQTSGIGSHKRKWVSDVKGNIYATLNFPIEVQNPEKTFLEIEDCCTRAIIETLESYFPEKVSYKWPNDVLVSGKKISGCLCEFSQLCGNYYQAIVGIGVNVNLNKEILDTIDQPATSMAQESNGKHFDVRSILLSVLENINKFQKQDSESTSNFLNARFALLGQRVLIHDDDTHSDFEACINGLKDGKLIVITDDAIGHEIINGTVQSLPNDTL